MVICKYYQLGNCRFGSKCANEHFDVKQTLKSDVESAINGKQWIFSCYGPFKDKPCIPNFIDDQSFEEVRYLCYAARQKNYFEQFHQQFNKEAMEAMNKMKVLLQLTPDVINVACAIYDTPIEGAVANAPVKANNPFGMEAATTNSLFSKPTTAPVGNVFGGSFGGTAATAGSIFGSVNNNAAAAQGSSIFGGVASTGFGQQNQNSMFAQAAKPTNSIFGGGAQQTNVFGQTQNSNATGGGLFAQAAQPNATNGNIFGQALPQQQQPQQQTPGFGLFSQAAQQNATVFNQQQHQQQQQQQNIFNQAAQQQNTATGNFFAQPTQQPMSGTPFAVNAERQQTQQMFAQSAPQQQATNIFTQQQMQPQAGLFQQSMQQMPAQQQQQQQQQQMQQQQIQQQQAFTPQAQPTSYESTKYSKMTDLTAEDIEAFKADRFAPGKIPLSPPPRELVN